MLSVIFVPIICIVLIGVLFILLSPRRKFDAPAAAQFQLKAAMSLIDQKNIFTAKDYKKLNVLVNKARSYIERAKFEDVYDMTIPQNGCVKAREITQSLLLVCPDDGARYLSMVYTQLKIAADYIFATCGVTAVSAPKMKLSAYSKKAKEDKAKAFLKTL